MSALGDRRQELLARLLREQGATGSDGIPRRDQDGPAPLSFAQQRLWFLDRLSPGNPFYNVQASIRHRGRLDANVLERAVNAVLARHEVLRTVFAVADGEPRQVVRHDLRLAIEHADFRRLAPERREAEAIRLAVEERRRPYDLACGPLARVKVLRLDEADHVVLLGMHHIVADGWSMGLLATELSELYESFVRGRAPRLAPLDVQYADFAVWHRGWLSGQRLEEQLGHWRRQLDGLPELVLPTDRPRPAVQAHDGAGFAFALGEDVATGLGAVAREHGATLFMALFAAWIAVLSRWCDQDEVVVGTPIAGRDRAQLEPLIGFFVNTLVLRVDTAGDPDFGELIRRVRGVALDAYAHADVPFERVVEDLAPQRDLSRNPLYQVTFQFFNSPTAPDAVAAGQQLDAPVTSSLFDLRVDVFRGRSGLAGRVEYDTALFDESSVRALIERFVFVAGQWTVDPSRRASGLDWVPPGQREQLTAFNATAAPIPAMPVPERLARWAAETPDAPAVGGWSYAELDERAGRLAGALDAGPGDVVAVCLPRGPELVAAALAAMRRGAAYLPLDVAYPPTRLAHILADGRPAAIVTTAALAEQLRPDTAVVTVDAWPACEIPPLVPVEPDELAYVIYTSGSTGTPKGVALTHGGLLNLVGWHTRAYAITAADRGGQVSSAGFDAAVWETWPQLYAGGSLHVCDDETRGDADALLAWLREERISVCFIPTPLAELLLDRPWPPEAPMRYLLTGGDTLRRGANPRHPYTLVNHYGPTEHTVVATACPVGAGDARPPIGAPIANTTAYVVDGAGCLAGLGQPGELLIGGPSLARGYHHDDDLTRRRFIPNPFATDPARLYRTGDRVRWRHDGTLGFLGRTDRQIKIRGHRIEPREIETLLATHPRVTQAVVTAGDELTAYVTVADDQVEHWQALYEQVYADGAPDDPHFDIRGWNRSADGAPLGEAVMREQVDQTVARVAALRPRRVLEIGCGTGLLLLRLAPGVERYVATDFSPTALARLAPLVGENVELLERRAHELDGLAGFDVVVINSVVQYFPDAAYLRRVLCGALGCLRPGGAIFVGDVRNHALLEAFHESVEREAGPADGLEQRVRRRVESEQELLLDPAWFTRFAPECGRETRVEAWLRRGRHHTELTRFRYDVLLTLDAGPAPLPGRVLEWEPGLDAACALRAPGVLVRGIPSARLRDDGVDPEDLWDVPGVAVGWHGSGADARMDAASTVLPAPPPRDGALSNDPARDERRTGAELRRWLQERLPEAMVPATVVVLDALPLTPHGKLDRGALPAPEPPERNAAPAAAASDAERRLAEVWAATLGLDAVGPDENFFELGGDSILSIKLVARAADSGIFFSTKDLFERQTVRELAQVVSSTRRVEAEQGSVVGPVPLTPIQRWFFEQDLAEPHHFNQAASIAVPPAVDAELLVRALRAVVAHHDALQLRFDGREARCEPFDGQLAVVFANLSAIAPDAVPGALDRVGGRLQASLALAGPLVRVGLVIHGPGRRRRLLIVIHHLAVDGVSWRILVEDLWAAYEQLASGLPASLPPKTTSYRTWAERLVERAARPDQSEYWLAARDAARLPRDLPGTDNRVAVTRSVRVGLDEAETDALLRTPGTVHDALVYAAARAVARWTGWSKVPMAIEGHGREALFDDVDLVRTVGWFTSIYPLVVQPDGLDAVASQLAAVPERGIGYGLARYLSPDRALRERLAAQPWPEISFNYLGRLGDEAPDPLAERVGAVRSPAGERAHLIEINGAIAGGRLAFDVFYSTAIHAEATARALAEGFMGALRDVLPRPGVGRVSERDLETVLARVAEQAPMTAVQADVDRVYALTALQEGLLVESLAAPGASLYLEQVVVELPGALSVPALAKAWRAVVDRHAVLRSSFHWEGLERPLQVVHRHVQFGVTHHDLGRLPPAKRPAAVRWYLERDKERPFTFERAPLLRVAVLRHGPARHQLVVTMHHILLDGWSLGIVMDDVSRLYRGFADGVPVQLPPPPVFGDYVAWVDEHELGEAERFWRRELGDHEGAPPLARRFGGHSREHDHRELELALSAGESAAARERARSLRVTLNTLVLGAWSLVLGTELGIDDVVVGTVVSGREAPVDGIERMVGLCINTVPVRVRLDGDRPAGAWLADLHARQLVLRDVGHCPLTTVHGWSGTPRGRPLFESIFIFENHADGPGAGQARAFERTGYPLTVIVGVTGALRVRILFDASVIGADAVRRLSRRLRSVVAGLVRGLDRPLREAARLSDEEREAVLALGRGEPVTLPEGWVHDWIAAQDPAAVALIDPASGARVCFGELNARAERLARRLAGRGIGRGDVVGVSLPRSPDLVVALLGVLRAGAAYLPLEPDLPEPRREFMATDADVALVLTSAELSGEEAEPQRVAGADIAWVLYTSGSTGRPKGVPGTHLGLANRINWGRRAQPWQRDDIAIAKSRLGFVDSVCELFAPLAAGIPVVLCDDTTAGDPLALAQLIARERVTALVTVPSLLALICDLAPETLVRLRRINISGEPLPPTLARRLPHAELWNIYGTTEIAADATAHHIGSTSGPRIPIGRPLDNTTIELHDPHGELVPLGATGEIVISGHGLSPGYIGHAHTDNHRFHNHAYRTGDLGRWREDGTLEHHGRADRQTKIRGARVEPDELEHALKTHPAINDAAVAIHDTPDGPELTAYYTTATPTDRHALHHHLSAQLPAHLIPTHLTELPELPHLPNGKLDRHALTRQPPPTPQPTTQPPETPTEATIASVYAQLTTTQPINRHDDFFSLGGHSLLATRLVSALNARFDIELPLGLVFDRPVVAELAQEIDRIRSGAGDG